MLTGILGFIGNFMVDHWIGLAVFGGILTSAGAAGSAGAAAKKTTQNFLEESVKEHKRKEE